FPKTIPDVVRWPIEGGTPEPLVQTTFAEFDVEISPDGRYLAYQSTESGQFQIYVRPYPKTNDGRWQISTNGGTKPAWAPSGRELFLLNSFNTFMSVSVSSTDLIFVYGYQVTVYEVYVYLNS